LCDQIVLIGSGLLWNVYFAVLALTAGFFTATLLALGKNSDNALLRKPAAWFIFLFRGSPLFIQFFFAYEAFVLLPRAGIELRPGVHHHHRRDPLADPRLGRRAGGPVAQHLGLHGGNLLRRAAGHSARRPGGGRCLRHDRRFAKFRRIVWPTMLRLAWPSYTNEAIFLAHATTLVFFSGFPARQQSGDALYYARYFADQTFNPFVSYPIVAIYFIGLTLAIIWLFGPSTSG
jgi:polar amino acid transport system permease protein